MSQVPNAFHEFLARYGPAAGGEGAVRFAQEVFGVDLDPWQETVLRWYGDGERRISIAACHGPGKTFLAAVMVWHQMITRFPQHVKATAPSVGQLEGALVKEVLILYSKLPPLIADLYEVTKNHIALKAAPQESWFDAATARAERPEALQGIHCDEGWVLLIADEASGVDEKIFEAALGSMSGHRATTLLLSNPTRSSGYFFDTHHKARSEWKTMRVSHEDSSRVSDDFVRFTAVQYGENSNAFRIRALGKFPASDNDTVIPYEYVDSARNRDIIVRPNLREVWGLDVARFGDDKTALVRRNGQAVLGEIREWAGQDTMQTAGKVKHLWDDTPTSARPEWILVDVIGLGAGVVDRLRELRLPVRGINVSEAASADDRFINLRAELWWKMREWLGTRDHVLPKCVGGCSRDCVHEKLAGELTVLRFEYTSSGKIQIESKRDLKKRGHDSPNIADAMMLTFATEVAGMVHGSSDRKRNWGNFNWHEPIRRGRVTV